MKPTASRYAWLRGHMCPGCPIQATCPQFAEQLDVCADARRIQREEAAEAKKPSEDKNRGPLL